MRFTEQQRTSVSVEWGLEGLNFVAVQPASVKLFRVFFHPFGVSDASVHLGLLDYFV